MVNFRHQARALFVTLFLLFTLSLSQAATWFVVSGSSGSGTGWSNGVGTIKEALVLASSGDQIWVKSGTFSLSETIVLKEGVDIYGGFAGTESSLSQRNLSVTPRTVLNGSQALRIFAQPSNFTTLTLVDGFYLINGLEIYGGAASLKSNGALANCIIANNKATGTNPGNDPLSGGGAIYADGSSIIANCLITNNEAEFGGGLSLRNGATVINSTIVNNKSFYSLGEDGRGIWLADNSCKIYNTVLWGNVDVTYNEIAINGGAPDVQNSATDDGIDYNNSLPHNNININTTNTPKIFINPNTQKGNIPSFNLGNIGDFTPEVGSPLIDAGNNSLIAALPAKIVIPFTGTTEIGWAQSKPLLHIINVAFSNKFYDGTQNATFSNYGNLNPADIIPGDEAFLTLETSGITAALFATKNAAAAPQSVTISGTYSLSGAASSKYVLVQPTGHSATINPLPITITPDANQSKPFGNSDPADYLHTTTPATITGDPYQGSLSRTPGEAVGTYAITSGDLTYNIPPYTNYVETFSSGVTFEITKRPLFVTIIPNQYKTYGDPEPGSFSYTVGGLAPGHSVINVAERAPGENAGLYPITQPTSFAVLDGLLNDVTANYDISYTSANFEIKGLPITIAADSQTKTYGDSDPALTYSINPALLGGDVVSGSLDREVGENKGTYTINQGTLSVSSNYNVTFIPSMLTIDAKNITITPDPGQTKIYGDIDPDFTYTFSPALIVGDSFTGKLGRIGGNNVGTYQYIIGTLSASTNYNLSLSPDNFTITKRDIAITVNANQTKTYGDPEPTLTFTASPALVAGDSWTGSLTRAAGETVGTYTISQGTLKPYSPSIIPSDGNYNIISFTGDIFTITKREVTMDNSTHGVDRVYDQTLNVTMVKGTLVNKVSGDDLDFNILSASFADKYAAVNKPITATFELIGLDKDNYFLTPKTDFTATIMPIDLWIPGLVTIGSVSKVYDATTNASLPTLGLGGILPGDVVSIGATSANYDTKHVGTNKTVTVNGITLSGSDAVNYFYPSIGTNSTSTITIKPLDPTIFVKADTVIKTYDGTTNTNVPPLTVMGLIPGDIVTASSSIAYFTSSTIGAKNKTVKVESIFFNGNDAGNYTINNFCQNDGCSINPVILDASTDLAITPLSKIYDSNNLVNGLTVTLTNFILGDDVSATFTSAQLDAKDAGSRRLLISGIGLNGTDAGNYVINNQLDTAFTVSPVTFTGTITFDPITKMYDGTNAIDINQLSPLSINGLFASDIVTATANAAHCTSINAGNTTVIVDDITYGGLDAMNYIMPSTAQNSNSTVAPFDITVIPDADQGHIIGGTPPALTYSTTPSPPNSENLSGTLTRESGDTVGVYKILQGTVSNANNPNYNITFVSDVTYTILQGVEVRKKWGNVLAVVNKLHDYKTFQWYKDGSPITGQTLPYYAIEEHLCGTYHLEVTLGDGTTKTSPQRIETDCDVPLMANIYPSFLKAGSLITIELLGAQKLINDGSKNIYIKIIDLTGTSQFEARREVQDKIQINAPLKSGSYIIVVSTETEAIKREKIVIQ